MTKGRPAPKWITLAVVAAAAMAYMLATTFAGSATGASMTTTWVAVSGAAFTPEGSDCIDYNHNNKAGAIQDLDGCRYVADVSLPQGAVVTGVYTYFSAEGGSGADIHLEEGDSTNGHTDIARIHMEGCIISPACQAKQEAHFESPDVNNAHFDYGLWMNTDAGEDCCGFTLFRVAIRIGVPTATAAGPSTASGPGVTIKSSND